MADEEWVERVARSLCREAGFDPDAAAYLAEPGHVSDTEVPSAPAWAAYVPRAQAHVIAARALKMI